MGKIERSGVTVFIDPITGKSTDNEIKAVATENQMQRIAETIDIDVEVEMERALMQEINHTLSIKHYESIRNHAIKNCYVHKSDYKDLIDIIEIAAAFATEPVIVLDPHLAAEIEPYLDVCVECMEDLTFPLRTCKTIQLHDKKINVFIYVYSPWDEQKCLIYDKTNPKNSLIVDFE